MVTVSIDSLNIKSEKIDVMLRWKTVYFYMCFYIGASTVEVPLFGFGHFQKII